MHLNNTKAKPLIKQTQHRRRKRQSDEKHNKPKNKIIPLSRSTRLRLVVATRAAAPNDIDDGSDQPTDGPDHPPGSDPGQEPAQPKRPAQRGAEPNKRQKHCRRPWWWSAARKASAPCPAAVGSCVVASLRCWTLRQSLSTAVQEQQQTGSEARNGATRWFWAGRSLRTSRRPQRGKE